MKIRGTDYRKPQGEAGVKGCQRISHISILDKNKTTQFSVIKFTCSRSLRCAKRNQSGSHWKGREDLV